MAIGGMPLNDDYDYLAAVYWLSYLCKTWSKVLRSRYQANVFFKASGCLSH